MKSLSFAALFCFLTAAGANAQRYEFSVLGGYTRLSEAPLGSIITNTDKKDTDTTLKGDYSYGARFTLNTKGYYGHEIGYIRSRGKMTARITSENDDGDTVEKIVQDRVNIDEIFYNFLFYMMPNGEWWRPYLTVGAQTFNYGAPNFPEWAGGSWRNYGANFGGGIKLRAKNLIFRVDFRDYVQGKPYGLEFEQFGAGGLAHQLEGSVGVGFTF